MDNDSKTNCVPFRRPLFIIAVVFALGVVLGRTYHFQTLYLIAATMFFVVAICFYRKKVFWLVCVGSALLAAFLSANAFNVDYADIGDDKQVEGRVYSQPYLNDYGSTVYLLDRASIDGQLCGNIKLYTSGDWNAFVCGDVITATAEVEIPKGVRNPGGFDEKMYLLSQGVHYKAYADKAELIGTKGGLIVYFTDARIAIADTMDTIFVQDIAPIAKAMLLGDKQGLDEQTYSAFKDTGMAHVLAVSGLHAGILIALIFYMLKLLKVGRTPRLIATLLFIAIYACLTGLAPSIVRASIMACALLIGTHFGRQTDTLNYLALSFIISLIANPMDLFSAGFQLSFGAVFGILTMGWQFKYWLARWVPKRLSGIGDAVSASVGATAGTMPILASAFNRVSVFSVITNIVIIPLASAAIVLVFISTIFGLLFGQVAVYVGYTAAALIRLLMDIINAVASVPFVAVDVPTLPWYSILACFVVLFICSKYVLLKTKMKTMLSTAICAVVVVAMLFFKPQGMYIVFLDVGQGDAAFIQTEQHGDYFIDGGRERSADEVVDFTIRNGYTPDAAFVSHTDTDHFSGIVALYEAGLLDKVY